MRYCFVDEEDVPKPEGLIEIVGGDRYLHRRRLIDKIIYRIQKSFVNT